MHEGPAGDPGNAESPAAEHGAGLNWRDVRAQA
jgi:hypothetical protein